MSRRRLDAPPVSDADMLRIASELDMLALTFPDDPSAETEAAVRRLQDACERISSARLSPSRLLRLPEEALLGVLRECGFRDLVTLTSTCHALRAHADKGAHNAISHQYSAELASLPPQSLRSLARLRWLENARKEAQQWLRSTRLHSAADAHVVWPKSKACRKAESAWLEAIARFASGGRDPSLDDEGSYSSDAPGNVSATGSQPAPLDI